MEYLQEITLEFNSNTAYTTVGAKQGDASSRVIKVHITENGQDWKIPTGVTASYRIRKPDGYAVWNPGEIDYTENTVNIVLTEQTLAVAGRAYADILLTKGTANERQVLSTISFIIIIMAAPNIVENIASSNEFARILDLTDNADVILNEAEAWALGTKKGVPVVKNNFSYAVQGGNFTCEIVEDTFREAVGQSPGYTRYFMFICDYDNQTIWNLQYDDGTTLDNIDLSTYGIRITGSPLPTNTIRVVLTDSDIQYHNNAQYYAEQAEVSRQAIENLTTTAEKVYADTFQNDKNYSTNDYVWYDTYIESLQEYQTLLYRFIKDHPAGEWNIEDVVQEILIEKTIIDPSEEENDEYVNLHFKLPQGQIGDVYFMTFDIDVESGELIMTKPDHMSPQINFLMLDNTDGILEFEILN